MSKRSKYTGEQKLQILQEVENEDLSLSSASRKYDINLSTIKDWILKYESLGIDSLEESRTWSHYTSEFKEMAVKSYLNQEGSYRNICVKYGIRDTKTLRSWVTRYNTGNSLNNTPGGTLTVDKGRKTSYEERIEITNHCLNVNKNYRETAEIYEVSYQQVYSWVKKLEKSGEKALIDLRGKEKEANKMTEFDKLKIENRKLKKVNEELETENQLLKKLEELEKRYR